MSNRDHSKMKLSEQKCESCLFWNKIWRVKGLCLRYPKPVEKRPGDWCGEWKGKITGTICRHTGEVKVLP